MSERPATSGKRGSCVVKGLVLFAVIALVAGVFWWWNNRPIDPVVLSAEEKQVVEQKVEVLQQEEPVYEPGKREIELSERELNGLLNEHTTLGDSVKFELATDAVHARVEMDLDEDLPVVGGKTLKVKARFLVHEDESGVHFVIEDVTAWGVSLPNDWLGGVKGQDLIGEAIGGKGGKLAGVNSLKIEPGKIRIELKE
ncbi:hypothetical protein ACFQY0_14890 [Haloferula chungangensis]|uniref:DUF2140 family protein n=1 Tax=Haloferula chungangensis TaxID=1048331 RepID=A0ABW2LAY2_9BACT